MGLFRRKLQQDKEGFYVTGISAETVRPNHITPLTIRDTDIIFTRLDDEIVAFSGSCPHAAADLGMGEVYRGRVTCPEHDWKFDIRSGRTLWPPDETCRLQRFPVKVIENSVRVQLVTPEL